MACWSGIVARSHLLSSWLQFPQARLLMLPGKPPDCRRQPLAASCQASRAQPATKAHLGQRQPLNLGIVLVLQVLQHK